MKRPNLTFTLLASCLIAASTGAYAQMDPNAGAAVPTSLPAPQVVGDVTFITGGFGDEERMAIENSKKDHNLYITNASTDGAFTGNSKVMITNSSGASVLDATAGPIFYAKLPAGTYKVTSTFRDQTHTKDVTVGNGKTATVDMKWTTPK